MATDTQKNFRKQMKELQKENRCNADDSVYSYVHKDFISSRDIFTRRRVIAFSGIGTFIVLVIMFLPQIMSMVNQVIAYKQKPIISYVQKIIVYDKQLDQVIQSTNDSLANINMRSVESKNKFMHSMSNNLNIMQSLISDAKSIDSPEDLKIYRKLSLEEYQYMYDAINSYIVGVANNNQDKLNSAKSLYQKKNVITTQKRVELMNVFDKCKIKYEIQSNGGITFHYKNF